MLSLIELAEVREYLNGLVTAKEGKAKKNDRDAI
jgi:hypothetical protein